MKAVRSFALVVALATVVVVAMVARQPASSVPSSDGRPPPGNGPTTAPAVRAVVDDGVMPPGATVYDEQWAGVTRLRPGLRHALHDATSDAAAAGITIRVNSGWRSPAYQRRLLAEAVARYGSEDAAARWVAPVSTSAHVSGDAVDVGPDEATAWLSRHGASYELCQIYRNEAWHFELRPGASRDGCPAMYADASLDPKRQP